MITYSDLYLGLLKYVKAVDEAMPIFIRGTPIPSYEGHNEWIAFEVVGFLEHPTRVFSIDMDVDIQLICYTRHATHRTDNKFTAMYSLLDKYAPLFHSKDVLIKDTCIQFKENRIVPLDLRTQTMYSKDYADSQSSTHILATVILNQGLISSTRLSQ